MHTDEDPHAARAAIREVIGRIKNRALGDPILWHECEAAIAAAIASGDAPDYALTSIHDRMLPPAAAEAYLLTALERYAREPPKWRSSA